MRIDGKAVFLSGARSLPYQPSGDNLLKFAFTRRLAGPRAACSVRSTATPVSMDGVFPENTSGQNWAADWIIEICAANTPSAIAEVFSWTARSVSKRLAWPLPASAAISGNRISATMGASMRSPAIEFDCRAVLRCFFMELPMLKTPGRGVHNISRPSGFRSCTFVDGRSIAKGCG